MQVGNSTQQASSASLLESLDGITNIRAFLALVIAAVASIATGALSGILFAQFETWSAVLGGVLLLLSSLIFLTGFSASGFLLMDQARGVESRSIMDAFLGAVFTLPKLIGIILTQVLILLTLILAVALLLAVCKIPGLGPVLYTLVFPVCAAISGVVLAGLFYVYTSLSLPSLWDGCTYREILARLWSITRHRLALVILMLVMLTFLTMFTSFVIGGITFGGMGLVGAMSAGILGVYGGFSLGNLTGILQIFSGNFGDGYIASGMLGAMLLVAAAMTLPMMVFIKGLCHIYLQSSDGLDFSEAERAIDERAAQVRRRAEEAQQRARESIEKSREVSKPAVVAVVNDEKLPVLTCNACHEEISESDLFCEHCGAKQK